jgi:hypothetical protein
VYGRRRRFSEEVRRSLGKKKKESPPPPSPLSRIPPIRPPPPLSPSRESPTVRPLTQSTPADYIAPPPPARAPFLTSHPTVCTPHFTHIHRPEIWLRCLYIYRSITLSNVLYKALLLGGGLPCQADFMMPPPPHTHTHHPPGPFFPPCVCIYFPAPKVLFFKQGETHGPFCGQPSLQ